MSGLIDRHRDALVTLSRRRHVRRLAVFGSAITDRFDPSHSDVDVLVEFEPLAPVARAEAFFTLLEDLERLFGRPVDLVERAALRNPYLRRSVEDSEVVVYEAA
jgi:predicted nucleotidyltransferase